MAQRQHFIFYSIPVCLLFPAAGGAGEKQRRVIHSYKVIEHSEKCQGKQTVTKQTYFSLMDQINNQFQNTK